MSAHFTASDNWWWTQLLTRLASMHSGTHLVSTVGTCTEAVVVGVKTIASDYQSSELVQVPSPTGSRSKGCQKSQHRLKVRWHLRYLAPSALWNEMEESDLKSLVVFQPLVTQEGLRVAPWPSFQPVPCEQALRYEWWVAPAAHLPQHAIGDFSLPRSSDYWWNAPLSHRGKGVPLQPCCQQPGLHWWACHPPGPHFLSNRWPHHVCSYESNALSLDQQRHVWPPDAAHLWVPGNPTLPSESLTPQEKGRSFSCPSGYSLHSDFWRREA